MTVDYYLVLAKPSFVQTIRKRETIPFASPSWRSLFHYEYGGRRSRRYQRTTMHCQTHQLLCRCCLICDKDEIWLFASFCENEPRAASRPLLSVTTNQS
eukprot:scaffold28233_cov31-Attheya_sp.AAC.1